MLMHSPARAVASALGLRPSMLVAAIAALAAIVCFSAGLVLSIVQRTPPLSLLVHGSSSGGVMNFRPLFESRADAAAAEASRQGASWQRQYIPTWILWTPFASSRFGNARGDERPEAERFDLAVDNVLSRVEATRRPPPLSRQTPQQRNATYRQLPDGSSCVRHSNSKVRVMGTEFAPTPSIRGVEDMRSDFWRGYVAGGTVPVKVARFIMERSKRHTSEPSTAEESEHVAFNFKRAPVASLKYADVGERDPAIAETAAGYQTIHPRHKMLLMLGVRDSGSDWLWRALKLRNARGIVPARDFHQRFRAIKEVRWFSNDALYKSMGTSAYLRLFFEYATQFDMQRVEQGGSALLDGTQYYLGSTQAAVRMRKIAPHASFVIVLRDPVARAISELQSKWLNMCGKYGLMTGEQSCKGPKCFMKPLDTIVRKGLKLVGQEKKDGDFACFFDRKMDHMNLHECLGQRAEGKGISLPSFLSQGDYAPQISWWLSFFPADRFLILTSQEIRDPAKRLDVLNRIVDHIGELPADTRFTEQDLAEVVNKLGLDSNSSFPVPPELQPLIPAMRRAFAPVMEQLTKLINLHWPHMHFQGLANEV